MILKPEDIQEGITLDIRFRQEVERARALKPLMSIFQPVPQRAPLTLSQSLRMSIGTLRHTVGKKLHALADWIEC